MDQLLKAQIPPTLQIDLPIKPLLLNRQPVLGWTVPEPNQATVLVNRIGISFSSPYYFSSSFSFIFLPFYRAHLNRWEPFFFIGIPFTWRTQGFMLDLMGSERESEAVCKAYKHNGEHRNYSNECSISVIV